MASRDAYSILDGDTNLFPQPKSKFETRYNNGNNESTREIDDVSFSSYLDKSFSPATSQSTFLGTDVPSSAFQFQTTDSKDIPSAPELPSIPYIRRLGWTGITIIVAGAMVILASISFLSFLWFSNWASNNAWLHLIRRGRLPISITLSTLCLRTAIGLQEGICTMMLAALALEQFITTTYSALAISTMRAFMTTPLNLAFWLADRGIASKPVYWRCSIFILIILLAMNCLVIQFSSTILLSDLATGTLPAALEEHTINYDYDYLPGGIYQNLLSLPQVDSWFIRPNFWPTFAEYTEQVQPLENVSDTGLTLRAFFPLSSSSDRERLHNYTGKALVLDSRVSCQAPILSNVSATNFGRLRGQISPSVNVPRLFLRNSSISFECVAAAAPLSDLRPAEQWPLTFCSITDPPYLNNSMGNNFAGGLTSEFAAQDGAPLTNGMGGMSFVLVNVTNYYLTVNYTDPNTTRLFINTTAMDVKDEWLHLTFSPDYALSVSLCYAAFDTADVDISAYGASNRTEPVPGFDAESESLTFFDVAKQLSQASNLSTDERGILQMQHKGSWIPGPDDQRPNDSMPFAVSQASWAFLGLTGLPTIRLWDGEDSGRCNFDDIYCNLFQSVLLNSGAGKPSVALAFQAILTATTSQMYYAQLPTFTKAGNSTQVFFIEMLLPRYHTGFSVLVAAVVTHLILFAIISLLFYKCSRFSMLGNVWQAISHIRYDEEGMRSILEDASTMNDQEVKKLLDRNGDLRRRTGLGTLYNGGTKISIVSLKEERE